MSALVRTRRRADVAVVLIDNPPINASSQAVRAGLLEAITRAGDDPEITGVVLMGAGSTFIAGSDLREFGKPLAAPTLPEVIAAVENCPKPVVAALHGSALGGGFELALGCDARIALPGATLGLPEVTLGIIPGAGGTQRLPRLTGIPRAIAMICAGERIGAQAAFALGIVERIAGGALEDDAVALTQSLRGRKQRVGDLPVPFADPASIRAAAEAALRQGKPRPAVHAAIDAISAASSLPLEDGLAKERALFQELRVSREARALRHQFFAEREAGKNPELVSIKPRPVNRIAVIGAGTMGTGIAIAALDGGYQVRLLERDQAALDAGTQRLKAYFQSRVEARKLEAVHAADREANLTSTLDWSTLSEDDLVIEAVFEDLAVKQDVFRRIDAAARPGAILASNTSYLDLDALAAVTQRPGDAVGLHFFSPAQVMRLLEVVRGSRTQPDVLATSLQVAKQLRKTAVVAANAFGFIGNRVYAAYRQQCEFMLEDGASPRQIDSALEGFGFAMGPFAVADMSGLDIAWRMRQSLAPTRDRTARYVEIPDMLCQAGRLGRKTGAGYYRYGMESNKPQDDPAVEQVLLTARRAKRVTPREFADTEIVKRVLLTMVNEAALLIAEKVAQRASDIDVVLVNGYGFPKWEGGPVFWAQELGAEQLDRDLAWLAEVSGPGLLRGDVRVLFAAHQSL